MLHVIYSLLLVFTLFAGRVASSGGEFHAAYAGLTQLRQRPRPPRSQKHDGVLGLVEDMVKGTINKKVAGHNWTLDDSEHTALDHAKGVIHGLMNSSHVQHDEDQHEVDRATELIANCSLLTTAALMGGVRDYKYAMEKRREIHSECRQEEADIIGEQTEACKIYNDYRQEQEALSPECFPKDLANNFIQAIQDHMRTQMETCLRHTKKWFDPLYRKYRDCYEAGLLISNVTEFCDIAQVFFESSFCEYVIKLEDTCEYQDECRAITIANRNLTHDSVGVSVDARKTDNEAAHRILCLFDVIDLPDDDAVGKKAKLNECAEKDFSQDDSFFWITYHDIPAVNPCAEEAIKPGHPAWVHQEYEHKEWYPDVVMLPSEACSAPPPPVAMDGLDFEEGDDEAPQGVYQDVDLLQTHEAPVVNATTLTQGQAAAIEVDAAAFFDDFFGEQDTVV